MKELILLMSNALPEDLLIEQIESDLLSYKTVQDELTRNKLHVSLMMLLTKFQVLQTKGGVTELMDQMKQMDSVHKIFNTDKN